LNFDKFTFHPQINAGISTAGYKTPTPIQEQAMPAILSGKDVLGLAQTGTGKTAAFVLPLLQRLMKGQRGKLRALIIAPTRELAEQTHAFILLLGKQTGLRSLTVYGGVSAKPQIRGLQAGVDIVVACPGRLLDLKDQRQVDLSQVEMLVLDEADHMFDMGFLPAIRRIIDALPAKRQTLLFSATMPDEIRSLAKKILYNPVTVEIGIDEPIGTIRHAVYLADSTQKLDMLLRILGRTGDGQVLVFSRTKHRTKKLAYQLLQAGVSTTSLQGNLSQPQREAAMNSFRKGKAKVMVATDIAARGIDVSQVTHVINYDMPDTAEAYTHRTGRTGRMEHLGSAVSLVTQDDLPMLCTIERMMGQTLELRKLSGIEATFVNSIQPAQPKPQRSRSSSSPKTHYRSYATNRR